MELRHLRYFVVVAEELHFKRAADRLHMEPQPLNFQIKQLERELGFPVLVRAENRMHLTAAGNVLLTDAREILASVDRAVDHAARTSRGEIGTLRISSFSLFSLNVLVPAMEQFRVANPDATVQLLHLNPTDQERALAHHEVDLGFGVLPLNDASLERMIVGTQGLVVAMRADHPLATNATLRVSELDGLDFVQFDPQAFAPLQNAIARLLTAGAVSATTVQIANDIDSILAFVAAGAGIAIVPEAESQRRLGDLMFLPIADFEEATVAVIWRRDEEHPLRDRFLEVLAARVETERMTAPHLIGDGV